ncbi:MAG: isochorismatase family protein [Microbacteriaceae bacterium]
MSAAAIEITGRDALLVVDVQNDFVSGSMAIPGAEEVIEPINASARAFEHVIVVTDWHPAGHVSFASAHPGAAHGDVVETPYGEQLVWADHCVQGTVGAELAPGLELTKAELVFRKGYRLAVDSYGAFYENDRETRTGLADYLRGRGIERVFVAGLARYGCVLQTALGAARDEFTVAMIDDGSAGRPDAESVAKSERLMSEAGIGWVRSADFATAG